jgi:hypothetical protein
MQISEALREPFDGVHLAVGRWLPRLIRGVELSQRSVHHFAAAFASQELIEWAVMT